jgi:hypothetical protein
VRRRRGGAGRRPTWHIEHIANCAAIPEPFTVEAYQKALNNVVGAPIRLVPLPKVTPDTVSGLTGMTVRLNGTYYILFRTDTSPVHQMHIIHHELFHVLEQHPGIPVIDPAVQDTLVTLLRPDLPHLSGDLIKHLIGRSCTNGNTNDRHERDAERFAVEMAERLGLTAPPTVVSHADTETTKLGRLLSDGHS